MTSRLGRRRRFGAARAIRWILVLQLAIAVFLVTRDVAGSWQGLSFAPQAPLLDQPVRPGDQTRRYDPRHAPALPARPGTDVPAMREMPERLQFALDDARLRLTGEIAGGDADRFAAWLDAAELAPEATVTVALDSPGGSVADALEIGRRLRAAGFATEVAAGAVCLSACPYMLAAGIERQVSPEGFVGVHQHYFGESTVLPAWLAVEDIQRGQAEVLGYLDEMGIDLRIMEHSLATPPDEIYILVADELEDYALVTPAG